MKFFTRFLSGILFCLFFAKSIALGDGFAFDDQLCLELAIVAGPSYLCDLKFDLLVLPMSPLNDFAFVVWIDLNDFIQVVLLPQKFANDKPTSKLISLVKIDCPNQCFQSITIDGFVGLTAFFVASKFYDITYTHITGSEVKRIPIDNPAPYFREEALIFQRIFFEQVFRHDSTKYSIPEIFQSFV